MNIRAWAERIPKEFYSWGGVNAYPRNAERYCAVLDSVQGMTTPSTMHLLNLAVQHLAPNECYLEVGTWRGATLIGALLNNDAYGVAIDDDSMNEHDGDERASWDVWRDNIARFHMEKRTHAIERAIPVAWDETWAMLIHTVPRFLCGVYLFDGDKSTTEAAYDGLSGVIPFLADEALIFIDDANEINIRLAAHKLERAYPNQVVKILDIPTPGNCWPCFWNGIMVLAWKRA